MSSSAADRSTIVQSSSGPTASQMEAMQKENDRRLDSEIKQRVGEFWLNLQCTCLSIKSFNHILLETIKGSELIRHHILIVDAVTHPQAGRETRAKYLTPYLSTKYNVEVEGITREPPLNPSVHNLRMISSGALPKELTLGYGDKQG